MRQLVEEILEDLSSGEAFHFRVICAGCGAAYGCRPKRFSKAGAVAENPSRQVLFDVLYEQEFRSARQGAIRSAAEQMNYCPVCRRLVCNACFLICEELDLCRNCADRLGLTGRSVRSDAGDGTEKLPGEKRKERIGKEWDL